jgi:hypothetical protein
MTDTNKAIDVNCETGEVTERTLTAEEITQRDAIVEARLLAEAEAAAAATAAAEAKASAEAKLTALGLTSDEVAAIIGR